jgi:hypothetical protein
MGFHADTLGESYVANDGTRTFEKFEAEFYNSNLGSIYELLGDSIHTETMELWLEFGMMSTIEYYEAIGTDLEPDIEVLLKQINEVLLEVVCDKGEAVHVMSDLHPEDNFCLMVSLLDRDGKPTVLEMAEALAKALHKKTGRYLGISHNSPTDGNLLIFLNPDGDRLYEPLFFKTQFIKAFEDWKLDPLGYQGAHSKAIVYQTLDDVLDRECSGDLWKEILTPNFEMWHQVMNWNRNGMSSPKKGGK